MSRISQDLQRLLDAHNWTISRELYADYLILSSQGHYIRQFLTERELEAFVDGHNYAKHGKIT